MFAAALCEIVNDPRPDHRRSVEQIADLAGRTPWVVYKWLQDENTDAINAAARLASALDASGDPRVSDVFHSARTRLSVEVPSTVDGDISEEVQDIVRGLSAACDGWRECPEEGLEGIAQIERAVASLKAELVQRLGALRAGSYAQPKVSPGGDGAAPRDAAIKVITP